jgi:hypothetical protein
MVGLHDADCLPIESTAPVLVPAVGIIQPGAAAGRGPGFHKEGILGKAKYFHRAVRWRRLGVL